MYTFFNPIPKSLDELKSLYRKLAMKHHPDKGGNTADMQKVNTEYETLFDRLKSTFKNAQGEYYQAKTESTEKANDFITLINELMKYPNLQIEIIGTFVWVTGETKPISENLKALKMKYSAPKTAWYLSPPNYRRYSRKKYDLEEIRGMYGVSASYAT